MRPVLTRSRGLGWVFAPFLLVACSAAVTPTDVPKKNPENPSGPLQKVAEDPPDFSPVAAPESLFLVARATNPGASWRALNKLHPIPVDLERELSDMTEGASSFIDLNGSFDAAMGVDPATLDGDDPDFSFAVSIPLKPMTLDVVEFLRKKGDSVESIGPGRYRIKSGEKLRCELWDIPERTPRLVCADDADQGEFREIVTLGQHLRPNEYIHFACVYGLQQCAPFFRAVGGVAIYAQNACIGEALNQ